MKRQSTLSASWKTGLPGWYSQAVSVLLQSEYVFAQPYMDLIIVRLIKLAEKRKEW
jgi:hypothetical protein